MKLFSSLSSLLINKQNTVFTPLLTTLRTNIQLAPRQRKYKKAQRGSIPVRIGGSQKGNFLTKGQFGLKVTKGVRLSDAVLIACSNILKRKIKDYKTSNVIMRVFPDIPVSAKAQGVRMGKGKSARSFWACRVPKDKIIFEISSPPGDVNPVPLLVAKDAFRIVSHCMPVSTKFVNKDNESPKVEKKRYPDPIPKTIIYHQPTSLPTLVF